jgi:hypothetical protein
MSRIIIAAAFALAVTLPAASAQAQNGTLTRSFVSSTGIDSNPCTIAQPCATFAQAYTKVGANGIVAALDPGKYGPLTVTGPVTVNGNGWAAITGPAQANAITINAGSGNAILTGLEVDSAGAAYNGIVFNTGDSLTVTNCAVQNFASTGVGHTTGNGIYIQPSSGISISPSQTQSFQTTALLVSIICRQAARPPRTGWSTMSWPPTINMGWRSKLRSVAYRRLSPYRTVSPATTATPEFSLKMGSPGLRLRSTTPASVAIIVVSRRLLRQT